MGEKRDDRSLTTMVRQDTNEFFKNIRRLDDEQSERTDGGCSTSYRIGYVVRTQEWVAHSSDYRAIGTNRMRLCTRLQGSVRQTAEADCWRQKQFIAALKLLKETSDSDDKFERQPGPAKVLHTRCTKEVVVQFLDPLFMASYYW
ncbi:hypothetical protein Tco_1503883 [Tanacetum coccineum]